MPSRGSESSRNLQRRLQGAGKVLSPWAEQQARSQAALVEFEREQLARVRRLLDRSERRIEDARRRRAVDECSTRFGASTELRVTVRGSCGSDVHLGSGES